MKDYKLSRSILLGFCMFCAYTRPRYKMSFYRTIGPLVLLIMQVIYQIKQVFCTLFNTYSTRSKCLKQASNKQISVLFKELCALSRILPPSPSPLKHRLWVYIRTASLKIIHDPVDPNFTLYKSWEYRDQHFTFIEISYFKTF